MSEKYNSDQFHNTLQYVKSKVSSECYQDILDLMEYSYNWCFKITREPKGDQNCDQICLGTWVNQTCNGGYTGDQYAGTVCIKITETEYFEYAYSM